MAYTDGNQNLTENAKYTNSRAQGNLLSSVDQKLTFQKLNYTVPALTLVSR